MSLRPVPARWFEVLVAREDTVVALEALARTGAVELEIRKEAAVPVVVPELRARLDRFHRLESRYRRYWPKITPFPTPWPRPPLKVLDEALEHLERWHRQADPWIERLEAIEGEISRLALWQELLEALPGDMAMAKLGEAGPVLSGQVFVLPKDAYPKELPFEAIVYPVSGERHLFLVALAPKEAMEALSKAVKAKKGYPLPFPSASPTREGLRHLRAALEAEKRALEAKLDELNRRYGLSQVLGEVVRIQWFAEHVQALTVSENFCWITGWTSDVKGKRLAEALKKARVRAVVTFPDPPSGLKPPMVFHNPWWARPFEVFPKLMGAPAAHEVDPSPLLAVIVPLIFGYMFGDVGHGLVLFMTGLVLKGRWPVLALLIPCGLASIAFGFAFGSVFCYEGIILPLAFSPLEDPLRVLVLPILGGMGLMWFGLLLGGLEAYWQGNLIHWLCSEAGVAAFYLGAALAPWFPWGIPLAGLGLLAYLMGNLWERGISVLGKALGKLLESALTLFVNTLSFARVGAFALAHGGLSLAVVTLAEGIPHPFWKALVVVLGNGVVIGLEGLVVAIQTTRLVLFEFFIRFLRAEGRIFRPLPAPPASLQGGH